MKHFIMIATLLLATTISSATEVDAFFSDLKKRDCKIGGYYIGGNDRCWEISIGIDSITDSTIGFVAIKDDRGGNYGLEFRCTGNEELEVAIVWEYPASLLGVGTVHSVVTRLGKEKATTSNWSIVADGSMHAPNPKELFRNLIVNNDLFRARITPAIGREKTAHWNLSEMDFTLKPFIAHCSWMTAFYKEELKERNADRLAAKKKGEAVVRKKSEALQAARDKAEALEAKRKEDIRLRIEKRNAEAEAKQ